jgi:hypothetical protein
VQHRGIVPAVEGGVEKVHINRAGQA